MTEAEQNLRPVERRGPKRESSAMLRAASQISEVASEDARLVASAQGGDRLAFARLFEKYRTSSYHIAYRLLGHQQDALDVTQEAFIKAFVGLDKFRGGSSFKTWLYRIVTNCSLDRRRSRLVRKSGSLDVEEAPEQVDRTHESDEPWRNLERKELKDAIDRALASIPENNRTAFVLFAIDGVSYREIAAILNISIGTVMSRIFYARQKLQRILSGQERATPDDEASSAEEPVPPVQPEPPEPSELSESPSGPSDASNAGASGASALPVATNGAEPESPEDKPDAADGVEPESPEDEPTEAEESKNKLHSGPSDDSGGAESDTGDGAPSEDNESEKREEL